MSPTARQTRKILSIVVGGGVLIIAGLAALTWKSLTQLLDPARVGQAHWAASDSMAPTIRKGDRFVVLRLDAPVPSRGAVIAYGNGAETWVSRVAGLPGDTIELRRGTVWIDGVAVPQKLVGAGPSESDGLRTTILLERFPGETTTHRILDAGETAGDDMDPVKVAAGTLFLLSDNRDEAADSRFPATVGGPGPIAIAGIIGRIASVYWASDRDRIGKPLDTAIPARR